MSAGSDSGVPVRLIVADDHPLYRAALVDVLRSGEGIELLATASDGREALELIRRHVPDIAILDMRMPHLDGREVMRRLRQDRIPTRVLFVSEYHGGDVVLQALTAGAAGYLSKGATAGEILDAIRRIMQGDSVLPSDIGTDVATALREHGEPSIHLTARELEVLGLIAAGETANVIAQHLHLAVPTVKTHIQNLYAKLGVNDRGAAVAEAMRQGLLS